MKESEHFLCRIGIGLLFAGVPLVGVFEHVAIKLRRFGLRNGWPDLIDWLGSASESSILCFGLCAGSLLPIGSVPTNNTVTVERTL